MLSERPIGFRVVHLPQSVVGARHRLRAAFGAETAETIDVLVRAMLYVCRDLSRARHKMFIDANPRSANPFE